MGDNNKNKKNKNGIKIITDKLKNSEYTFVDGSFANSTTNLSLNQGDDSNISRASNNIQDNDDEKSLKKYSDRFRKTDYLCLRPTRQQEFNLSKTIRLFMNNKDRLTSKILISEYTIETSLKINSDYDIYGCCFSSNSCILAVNAMTWSDSWATASSFILS